MKKVISVLGAGKRKASAAIICCALILSLSTGIAFAASANNTKEQAVQPGNVTNVSATTDAPATANPSYGVNSVGVANMSPSEIVEQSANRFDIYKDYGLTYDKTADRLYYNGELVRYFEDMWPLDENSSSGMEHFTENGTVDIHAVRDLSQIKQNPDGSIDPSGKLNGVKPYSQAEFNARDIDELKNPTKSASTTYASNNVSNVDSQSSSQNSNPQYKAGTAYTTDSNKLPSGTVTTTVILDGPAPTPDEMAEMLSIYKPFGVTYDKDTGNIYYDGKLVSLLTDTLTSKGEVQGLTSYGDPNGVISIKTVRDGSQQDANGYDKLISIEISK